MLEILLNSSLAHEIVMSMPSLYKNGGLLLVFPCRQAAKILGRPYREYIASILGDLVTEIPVAIHAVVAVQKVMAKDE